MSVSNSSNSIIRIVNINVLDNPSPITHAFQFEIVFESQKDLPEGTNFHLESSNRFGMAHFVCRRSQINGIWSNTRFDSRGANFAWNTQVLFSSMFSPILPFSRPTLPIIQRFPMHRFWAWRWFFCLVITSPKNLCASVTIWTSVATLLGSNIPKSSVLSMQISRE